MTAESNISKERILLRQPEVTRRLRENRPGDPETVAFLARWIDQEIARVGNREISGLTHNMELAEVYRDAGWTEEALYQFYCCFQQANMEGTDEEYKYCETELLKLKTLLGKDPADEA